MSNVIPAGHQSFSDTQSPPQLRVVGGVEDGVSWEPEDRLQQKAVNLMNAIQFENVGNQYGLRAIDDCNVQTCTALLRLFQDRGIREVGADVYALATDFLNRMIELMPVIEAAYPASPVLVEMREYYRRCGRMFPHAFAEPELLGDVRPAENYRKAEKQEFAPGCWSSDI